MQPCCAAVTRRAMVELVRRRVSDLLCPHSSAVQRLSPSDAAALGWPATQPTTFYADAAYAKTNETCKQTKTLDDAFRDLTDGVVKALAVIAASLPATGAGDRLASERQRFFVPRFLCRSSLSILQCMPRLPRPPTCIRCSTAGRVQIVVVVVVVVVQLTCARPPARRCVRVLPQTWQYAHLSSGVTHECRCVRCCQS